MIVDSDELLGVLSTLTALEFRAPVARIRSFVAMEGTLISKNERAIPSITLRDIYRARAFNHRLSSARAEDCERLAQVADKFLDESWYLYVVSRGVDKLAVFANENGFGRFCLELAKQDDLPITNDEDY